MILSPGKVFCVGQIWSFRPLANGFAGIFDHLHDHHEDGSLGFPIAAYPGGRKYAGPE